MNNRDVEKRMMSIVAEDGSIEEDENENITVYVSNVDRTGEEPRLLGVDTEEEWNRIKDVLRELSKSE